MNEWSSPPNNIHDFYRKVVPESSYYEVAQGTKGDAMLLLESTPFIEISKKQGEDFIDGALSDIGRYLYLIRALRCSAGGKFILYRNKDEIYVSHGDFWKKENLDKSALVYISNTEISNAYTDCSLVE